MVRRLPIHTAIILPHILLRFHLRKWREIPSVHLTVSVNSFRSDCIDGLEMIRYADGGDIRYLGFIGIWGGAGGHFGVGGVGSLHRLFDGAQLLHQPLHLGTQIIQPILLHRVQILLI